MKSLLPVSSWPACSPARPRPTSCKLDSLSSKTPDSWKKQQPQGRLRYAQYLVPRAEGDAADAELVIFKGLGGSAKANVDRWKGQFVPPEGKNRDDVAKLEEFKVAGFAVHYLDVSGTFLDGPPNMAAKDKKRRENYRMLAVQFEGPENVYHIKLTGPEKTVAEHKKGFDAWLKGFKK